QSPGVPGSVEGRGLCEAQPPTDVSEPTGALAPGAPFAGFARAYMVGGRFQCNGRMGGTKWHEPSEFHFEGGRKWQTFPPATGRTDQGLSRRMEGSGPPGPSPNVGKPIYFCIG